MKKGQKNKENVNIKGMVKEKKCEKRKGIQKGKEKKRN